MEAGKFGEESGSGRILVHPPASDATNGCVGLAIEQIDDADSNNIRKVL
jgi:hypothetical protein